MATYRLHSSNKKIEIFFKIFILGVDKILCKIYNDFKLII